MSSCVGNSCVASRSVRTVSSLFCDAAAVFLDRSPPDTSPSDVLPEAADQQLLAAPPRRSAGVWQVGARTSVSYAVSARFIAGTPGWTGRRERLWPLVPSRREDLEAIAAASWVKGWDWAMVVRDPDSLESSEAETFVDLFFDAGGGVKSYTSSDIQSVDPEDEAAFQRFSEDMLWSRVPTMVVAADPNGELAQKLREAQRKAEFGLELPAVPNWVWISGSTVLAEVSEQPWQQLGLMHAARGEGWSSFAKAFEALGRSARCLRPPATTRLACWPSLGRHHRPCPVRELRMPWVGWIQMPNPFLSEGFQLRQQGKSLRIPAAASDFRLMPAQAPSGSALAGLLRG